MTLADLFDAAQIMGLFAFAGVVILLAVGRERRHEDEIRDRERPVTPLDWRRGP